MKEITSIEEVGGIKIAICSTIERDLTQEERMLFSKCMNDMYSLINKTDELNSQEFKDQVVHERNNLLACFPKYVFVEEVPNEYGGLAPWYQVTTNIGRIKIGWRKRVISIDWTGTNRGYAKMLFREEMVTKTDKIIHADGYEKAKEYINTLLN